MGRFLEAMAQERWAMLGSSAREIVALGFEDPEDDTIVWYELTNDAGVGEFSVSAETIEAAIRLARREGVDERSARYLWHSHYLAVEPSAADLEQFPAWLVEAGIVFHAPTGTSTVYNAAGIISISSSEDAVLATSDIGSERDDAGS